MDATPYDVKHSRSSSSTSSLDETPAKPTGDGHDRLTKLFEERTQMCISVLLPFLDMQELVNLYQVNRYFKSLMTPGSELCIRFDVLFMNQGDRMAFAPADWKEQVQAAS